MALDVDQLYNKYQGQSLDYDGVEADRGQCVQWVEYALTDTQYGYGLKPFYGNAIDWWNNYGGSLEAFDKITDGSIKKGDIVIFNSKVGSVYGHIDLALQDGTTDNFLGADSNWSKDLTVHQVRHIGSQYVVGSLRLKGGANTPQGDEMNAATVELLYQVFGVPYGQNDIKYFTNSSVDDFVILLNNNPAHKAQVQTLNNANKGFTPVTDQLYKKG